MALAIWFVSGAARPRLRAPKIAVVNLQTVLETSVAGKAAQSQLKSQRDKLEADLKQKGTSFRNWRSACSARPRS
jgi:Skp family chaperone for outer membrane proteins